MKEAVAACSKTRRHSTTGGQYKTLTSLQFLLRDSSSSRPKSSRPMELFTKYNIYCCSNIIQKSREQISEMAKEITGPFKDIFFHHRNFTQIIRGPLWPRSIFVAPRPCPPNAHYHQLTIQGNIDFQVQLRWEFSTCGTFPTAIERREENP